MKLGFLKKGLWAIVLLTCLITLCPQSLFAQPKEPAIPEEDEPRPPTKYGPSTTDDGQAVPPEDEPLPPSAQRKKEVVIEYKIDPEEPTPLEYRKKNKVLIVDDPDEPHPSAEIKQAALNAAKAPKQWFALGAHFRMNFIRPYMLKALLEESTPMTAAAFGVELLYRRGGWDFIASIDYAFYRFENGNYLERGDNPVSEVDYIQFDDLRVLSLGVHFIRRHKIMSWLDFVWGGGVGVGFVSGDVFRASAADGCDASNAGDEYGCTVEGMDPYNPGRWLNDPANQGVEDEDGPGHPKRYKESIWPIVPVIHFLVGLNFRIDESINMRVDGGFRNALYIGSTIHYYF